MMTQLQQHLNNLYKKGWRYVLVSSKPDRRKTIVSRHKTKPRAWQANTKLHNGEYKVVEIIPLAGKMKKQLHDKDSYNERLANDALRLIRAHLTRIACVDDLSVEQVSTLQRVAKLMEEVR